MVGVSTAFFFFFFRVLLECTNALRKLLVSIGERVKCVAPYNGLCVRPGGCLAPNLRALLRNPFDLRQCCALPGDAVHLSAFVLSEKSCTAHFVIHSDCAWMSGSLTSASLLPLSKAQRKICTRFPVITPAPNTSPICDGFSPVCQSSHANIESLCVLDIEPCFQQFCLL